MKSHCNIWSPSISVMNVTFSPFSFFSFISLLFTLPPYFFGKFNCFFFQLNNICSFSLYFRIMDRNKQLRIRENGKALLWKLFEFSYSSFFCFASCNVFHMLGIFFYWLNLEISFFFFLTTSASFSFITICSNALSLISFSSELAGLNQLWEVDFCFNSSSFFYWKIAGSILLSSPSAQRFLDFLVHGITS